MGRAYNEISMLGSVAQQFSSALRTLNPGEVRRMARRPVVLGLLAASEDCVEEIHDFLYPKPDAARDGSLLRVAQEEDFERSTVGFAEYGIPHPAHFYTFDELDPGAAAGRLLDAHEDCWLPLACRFPGLRPAVSERLIWRIAKENALFTVGTALPNFVPTVISLPWAVGEFASDTAFLTANQVRLSFLLAAAHGHDVGYNQQGAKIGSIIGAAFGWRALARELVSKIPAGGGLVSKGLIAFAGTYAVGRGLEYWFQEGALLGRAEQRKLYADARRRGRETVERIVRSALSAARPVEKPA